MIPRGQAVWSVLAAFDAQASPLEGDKNPLLNTQYLLDTIVVRIYKKKYFEPGPMMRQLRKSNWSLEGARKARNIRVTSLSYLPNHAIASDNSSGVVSVEVGNI